MNSSPMARMLRLCAVAGLAISAHWAVPAWAAGAMTTGGLTSQPIGHYDFCKAHPGECNIRPADLAPAKMTGGLWRKLISVSARVNA
ncbi:MAG: transglutaminase, partial [Mesorhizobium sp.]